MKKEFKLFEGIEEDYIEINHLHRVGDDRIVWSVSNLVSTIKANSLQIYVIGPTDYGCFVGKPAGSESAEFQFFQFSSPEPGLITPTSTPDFSDVLDSCDPDYLEGLLYHLDIIVGKKDA